MMLPKHAIVSIALALIVTQTPAPAPKTAQVHGRVFDATTGKPLHHARVVIFSREAQELHQSETDEQGRYEFTLLPAGRYRLGADKDGYLGVAYGQTRPTSRGQWLELTDGQALDKIDFTLPRGGVITGRIVDEYGDPAPNLSVVAARYGFAEGRRVLRSVAYDTTDDRGSYRLYGLQPGQYFVSAVLPHERNVWPDEDPDADDADAFAPTYYPGTPNVTEGRPVTVGLGDTIDAIDFKIVPMHTARVTGTALNSKGLPLRGSVAAFPTDTLVGDEVRGQVQADGSFVIKGLPPGEYELSISGASATKDLKWESAQAHISIAGRDIDHVQLAAGAPVHVSGRVVIDPGASAPEPPLTASALHVRVDRGPIGLRQVTFMGETVALHDDWTFATAMEPGLNRFSTELPTGWVVKAVRVDGVDVMDAGIDVKPNHDLRGVEIDITNRPSRVIGTVTNDREEPVKDYVVVVFPHDEQRWKSPTRYVVSSVPDQDGHFDIRVPPGDDYLAIALDELEEEAWTDPELLRQLRDRATPFSLGDGETHPLSLKIETRP
jgi:Carboxypeptidase regulatory-like domain